MLQPPCGNALELIRTCALAMAAQPAGSLKTTEKLVLAADAAVGVTDTTEGMDPGAGVAGTVASDGHSELLPAYCAVTLYEPGSTGMPAVKVPSVAVVAVVKS